MKEYIIRWIYAGRSGAPQQARIFGQNQSIAIRNLREQYGDHGNDSSVVIMKIQEA